MNLARRGARAPSGMRVAVILITAFAMILAQGVIVANGTWQSMLEPQLISVAYDGTNGDDDSWGSRINDDGRYIVFESDANNLTVDDGDSDGQAGEKDVFRHDRVTGITELVSKSSSPTETVDRGSKDPRISDDGRYVMFFTGYGFVPADTNGDQDIYIKDMDTGTFRWVDFYGDGSALYSNAYDFEMSGDASYVIFEAWGGDLLGSGKANAQRNVWGYDLASDEATLVSAPAADEPESVANRGSRNPAISDDGRYVAFLTGDDWDVGDGNNEQDIYIRDLQTGLMRWVDFSGDGGEVGRDVYEIEISGDGTQIVFQTGTALLPEDTNSGREDVYGYNLVSDEATLVSGPTVDDRGSRSPQLTDDGDKVLFHTGQSLAASDPNGDQDLYMKDLVTGEFTRIPVLGQNPLPGGDVWDITLSGDGMHIAFKCDSDIGVSDDNGDDDIYYVAVDSNALSDGPTRIKGTTRYTTAVEVSKKAFPVGADTVVIATGEDWPDALGGAALAGAVDGPILLTHSGSLDASVRAELIRLGARNVYLLGGYAAVSPTVEAQLEVLLDGYVWRIGGPDRYATSKAVANRAIEVLGGEYDGTACVTTGMDFPDAVGAAPLGAGLGWPVLLVRPMDPTVLLPPSTDSVVILGGSAAVGTKVETYLKTTLGAMNVDRVGGATRYETSALAAQYGVDHGLLWNGVGISSGSNYPDALTGGAALGLYRTTMLLTPPTSLHPAAGAALTAHAAEIQDVTFLGGTAAVSTTVENQVKAKLGL